MTEHRLIHDILPACTVIAGFLMLLGVVAIAMYGIVTVVTG